MNALLVQPSASPVKKRPPFESLLDECSQGVLIVDARCRVTFANRAIMRLLPVCFTEQAADLSCCDEARQIHEALQLAITCQRRTAREACLPPAGEHGEVCERVLNIAAGPLSDEQGGGAWCLLDDITETFRADQIRRDFVNNASHELRTPLSIIHGYIETLRGGMIKNGPSLQRCLEVMEKHSRRMMRIIEDMLTISRLEGDDAHLKMENFHVRACVEDVIEHLTPLVELRQPRIDLEFPPGGDLLHGDRFYWDQIFTNLIENALKENPRADLHLRIRGEWHECHCVLTVTDDGIGIPAADLPFVFNRFYRCDKSRATTPESKSTGLGLCIVKRAVEAHGGAIEATSIPDQQTSFIMRVPLVPALH